MACTNHTKRVRFCGINGHGGFVRNFSNHVVGCLGPSRPIDGVLLEHHIDVQSQGKKRPFPLRPDGPCGHGRTTMPDESLPPAARRRCCPAGRRKSNAMGGQGRIVAMSWLARHRLGSSWTSSVISNATARGRLGKAAGCASIAFSSMGYSASG